jgi:hypothetical protein
MAPTLTAEAWAQIRYDYEHTERRSPDGAKRNAGSGSRCQSRMSLRSIRATLLADDHPRKKFLDSMTLFR